MARCCGSTGTCACKIEEGRNITISGSGTAQDPFVVDANVALAVEDTPVFDLGLTGAGTLASPWFLSVRFTDAARLNDIPDVQVDSPSSGQVLGWSQALGKWVAQAPTTAAAGGMTTDTSLLGDGSIGAPLQVREDGARFITTTASGLGLSDTGINGLVRKFPDAIDRAAASPTPVLGALSVLATSPTRVDVYDGTGWVPITNGVTLDVQGDELLALSGSYANGDVTQRIENISVETDAEGSFDVIGAADLVGTAGVLSVHVQPTGGIPWVCMVEAATDHISGTAYRLDTGAPYAGVVVTASVTALLY